MSGVAAVLAAALLCVAAADVRAQQTATPAYVESRVDVVAARSTAVQAGAGVVLPLGIYVRLSMDGAIGATWRDAGVRTSGRVDVLSRFLLDPFRELPWALSLGGGVSVPYVQGDRNVRPYLTAVIDVEGRRHGSLTPALQLGLGGGARIGLVLRASPTSRR